MNKYLRHIDNVKKSYPNFSLYYSENGDFMNKNLFTIYVSNKIKYECFTMDFFEKKIIEYKEIPTGILNLISHQLTIKNINKLINECLEKLNGN